ncbi:MAG: hypothetical protein HFACDABA_01705 [Anaerolineales bacterium]|nr:hypothetical protein [Anaerolineales bacterium]
MTLRKRLTFLALCLTVLSLLVLAQPKTAEAVAGSSNPAQDFTTKTPAPGMVTPADIINAVNNLRLANGLNALTVHSALMAVAADQANALAASEGAVGHARSCGMTLGQDLLSRGFPLLGDLSLDGYRSENWVSASTVEDAMRFWQSDAEHLDTMLDPNRSHIGAAVAVSDQIYMVLETAFATSSGQMQYDAYPILTGIPQTQSACYGMYTQAATMGVSVDEIMPVFRNTALPNGDVYHEVKYGQTLWTLAIQYNTTILDIKKLNRLSSDVISPGMKLLIQTGATQPAGTPFPSPSPVATRTFPWALETPSTPSPAVSVTQEAGPSAGEFVQQNGIVIVAIVISFSVLLAGLGVMGSRNPK